MNNTSKKTYDMIFLGTSMISILEAVFQNLSGKSVLMIDDQEDVGGAWLPINLFGAHDVENAIHYFLPDTKGFKFMKEALGWRVVKSYAKYRVFPQKVWGFDRIVYDNPFSRPLAKVSEKGSKKEVAKLLWQAMKETVIRKNRSSYYVVGGCAEMLTKIKSLLAKSQVETLLSTVVEDITMDPQNKIAHLTLKQGDKEFQVDGRVVNFTHGSKVKTVKGPRGPLKIERKIHPRPAGHLLVEDPNPTKLFEVIFTNDNLLRYAHDITRYTREASQLEGKRKIFAMAFHKDVLHYDGIDQDVFKKLKMAKILGTDAVLKDFRWWDVFLPALEDADLEMLKNEFGDQVSYLKTENFAQGVGLYADRWSTKIQPLQIGE